MGDHIVNYGKDIEAYFHNNMEQKLTVDEDIAKQEEFRHMFKGLAKPLERNNGSPMPQILILQEKVYQLEKEVERLNRENKSIIGHSKIRVIGG